MIKSQTCSQWRNVTIWRPPPPAEFFWRPTKTECLKNKKRSPLFFGAPPELFVPPKFFLRLQNAKLDEIFTVFRWRSWVCGALCYATACSYRSYSYYGSHKCSPNIPRFLRSKLQLHKLFGQVLRQIVQINSQISWQHIHIP